MLKISIGMLFSLFVLASGPALAESSEIERKINELNSQSVKMLGVSLSAVAYLMNASSTSYIPMWHLEKSGDIAFMRELEQAGYVKTEVRRGLPNGQESNERFMRIIPLGKGEDAVKRLYALPQHNNCIEGDASR